MLSPARGVTSASLRSEPLRPSAISAAFFAFACACSLALVLHPAAFPSGTPSEPAAAGRTLPLSFVPNRGQLDSGEVRYYAPGSGFTIYLTKHMAAISLVRGDKGAALHLHFVGANPHARLVARDRARGRVNYLSASERHENLPTYRALTYRNLWPGIDMTFRSGASGLEYEFLVRPGADPSNIRLGYAGADGLSVSEAGALRVQTPAGTLTDSMPRSYQRADGRQIPVRSGYVLRGKRSYGFAVSPYDAGRPLVIDPSFGYSTFLGGSSSEQGWAIDVDPQGRAVVAGTTSSSDFPTTPGSYDVTPSTGDMFVTKLSRDGSNLVYSTFLSGAAARGLVLDGDGNVYVTGFSASTDFPTTPGSYDPSFNGSFDTFLAKLDPTGSRLVFSSYLGGSSFEGATAIAVDASGSAYLTGNTASADFPVTPGAYQTANRGGNDVFVTRFDPTGSKLLYSTFLGSSDFSEFAYGLAIDAEGNAYVTGTTRSAVFPTTDGAYDRTANGDNDGFVSKLSGDGSRLLASTYLGAAGYDTGSAAAVDTAGNPYVLGDTCGSGDFPTTPGAYDTTFNGSCDMFVTKLDSRLSSLSYSTYLGGSGLDSGGGTFGGHSLEIDGRGRAHLVGTTSSRDFPTTTPGPTFSPSYGVAVARLDPSGSALTYSTVFGGDELEALGGLALDSERNVYVTGLTDSADFPTTPGAYDTTRNGTSDAFVTKLLLQPASTPGCEASAGGQIVTRNGDKATFGGSVQAASEQDVSGNLDYVDHGPAAPLRMRAVAIDALGCDGARATIQGLASVDGSLFDFRMDLLDAGEPGRADTYRLQLSSGYDSGTRTLTGGNVQVRSG